MRQKLPSFAAALGGTIAAAVMADAGHAGEARERGDMIVFVDSAVRNAEQLLDGMPEGAINPPLAGRHIRFR